MAVTNPIKPTISKFLYVQVFVVFVIFYANGNRNTMSGNAME